MRSRVLRDAAACIRYGSARLSPEQRHAIADACEELAAKLEEEMMFPKFRVYVEFEGFEARESAEKFKALMEANQVVIRASMKAEGIEVQRVNWHLVEERED